MRRTSGGGGSLSLNAWLRLDRSLRAVRRLSSDIGGEKTNDAVGKTDTISILARKSMRKNPIAVLLLLALDGLPFGFAIRVCHSSLPFVRLLAGRASEKAGRASEAVEGA